jgi:hypothetical protein
MHGKMASERELRPKQDEILVGARLTEKTPDGVRDLQRTCRHELLACGQGRVSRDA